MIENHGSCPTTSESDGIPMDYFNPGECGDHHYANFPAGFDKREITNIFMSNLASRTLARNLNLLNRPARTRMRGGVGGE